MPPAQVTGNLPAMVNISDRVSLRSWLRNRSREDAVMIAHRAAMRVAPIYWILVPQELPSKLTELPILCACLISRVAGIWPTPEIRSAAAAAVAPAAAAADLADNTDSDAAARAADAATLAAEAVAFDVDTDIANAAVLADAAADAVPVIWTEIRTDCAALEADESLISQPLWANSNIPFANVWQATRQDWSTRGPGWRFWIDWYEDALAGRMPNRDLLTKVALIDPADWDKGIEHVNGLIAEFFFGDEGNEDQQINRALVATGNAERLEINQTTGKLRAVPESDLPADDLTDVTDKLKDANEIFNDIASGNEMYANLSPERTLMADAVVRYASRPLRLYDACRRAERRVTAKIKSDELPGHDALISDYTTQLNEAATDIRSRDERVADVVATRVLHKMGDLPGEAIDDFVQAAEEVSASAEGYLAAELPDEARTAVDPDAPEGERKEALNATVGRLVRAYTIGRNGLKDAAGLVKDVALVGGASGATGAVAIGGYLWMTGKLPVVLPWLLALF